VQEEIANAVVASGQTLDKGNRNQLSVALGIGNYVLKAGDTMTGPLTGRSTGMFTTDLTSGFGLRIAADPTDAAAILVFGENATSASLFTLSASEGGRLNFAGGLGIGLQIDYTSWVAEGPVFHFNYQGYPNFGTGSVRVRANLQGYSITTNGVDLNVPLQCLSNNVLAGQINCDGTGITIVNVSDSRLKIDEGLIGPDWSGPIIDGLQPRFYQMKSSPESGVRAGFFADEVLTVYPPAVYEGHGEPGDADFRAMMLADEMFMVPVIAELKALRQRVQALEGSAAA
jgi:hypothetical protein